MRLLSLLVLSSACGGHPAASTTPPADNRTLFERLGGQPAINALSPYPTFGTFRASSVRSGRVRSSPSQRGTGFRAS